MNKKKTAIRAGSMKEGAVPIEDPGQDDRAPQADPTIGRLRSPSLRAQESRIDVVGSEREGKALVGSSRKKIPGNGTGKSEMRHIGSHHPGKRSTRSRPQHLDGRKGLRGSKPVQEKATHTLKSVREALSHTKKELKKTAGDLGRLSEYLHTLLDNIHFPLLIVGRDFRIRYASQEAQRMLNLGSYAPAVRITDTLLSLQVPRLRKLLGDVMADGASVEREIQDEDNRWHRVLICPYIAPRAGIDGIVITLVETDSEKRLEALLTAERRRVSRILDASGGLFVELDLQGTVLSVNRRGCEILKCAEKEVVGTNWFDWYVDEASRDAGRTAMKRVGSRGDNRLLSGEILIRTKTGEEKVLKWGLVVSSDAAGLPRSVFGVGEDITLWRAAHLSALENEARFRLLLGMEPESDFLTTDCSGNVTSWYGGSGPARKYVADEVIGKHLSLFFPQEDFLAGRPMRLLRIAEAEGRHEEIAWCVGRDGSRRRAKYILSPTRNQEGKLTGFAGVIRLLGEYSYFEAT